MKPVHPTKRHNGIHLILVSETYGRVEIAGTYFHRDRERTFRFDYFDNGKLISGVFERDEWTIK